MKKLAISLFTTALVGSLFVTSAFAASKTKNDFALLDMEPGVADQSVQAGAISGKAGKFTAAPFTVHITMTNRGDLGGTNGFVRVTYKDGDFVDYAIPVGTTVQITLAGGGTLGVDDIITVTGTGGAVLIGQISITTEGSPHPNLPGQNGSSFATTTPKP